MNNYTEHFQQLRPTFIGNDLPWMLTAREQNLDRFIATGFPNRHMEDWKYTDLSFLNKKTFTTPINQPLENLPLNLLPLETRIVFVDGHFNPALSKTDTLPNSIILCSFKEALAKHPEKIAPYLTQIAAAALVNLNTAFLTDGLLLHIPKNTELKSPIHLLFLSTQESTFVNHKNIFIIEEHAKATLFEEHIALHEVQNIVKNISTQIEIKTNGYLEYYKLQQENKAAIHIGHTEINQARDSQLYNYSISLGSKLARDNLNIQLNDKGASCELNGFYGLSDTQHIDHHTRVDHYFPNGSSSERYKGILKDQAKGVFNGKVIVHPDAQQTKSQQINKNLLLSSTAEMNTKPELEIYADDVQCTHGATVGQIEPDALFYLRSRGLSEDAAMHLLVHAFCDDILQYMRHPDIANHIQKAITAKIENFLIKNIAT